MQILLFPLNGRFDRPKILEKGIKNWYKRGCSSSEFAFQLTLRYKARQLFVINRGATSRLFCFRSTNPSLPFSRWKQRANTFSSRTISSPHSKTCHHIPPTKMTATPKPPADETKANHGEPITRRAALISSCQQLQDMIEDKSLREVSVTSLVLEFCIPTKDIGGVDHQPWGEQTLDLHSFSNLQSLCIKERTGKIRFKKKGEDPRAQNRMTLILPKSNDDDGFQNVTFEWLSRTSENYYDGLSESLRKELHNRDGIQIKEWVRDETMVQKKLFTLEEMEENKWKTHLAKLKG